MRAQSYPKPAEILRRSNLQQNNINVLAPGIDLDWSAPDINTIQNATTPTDEEVVLGEGIYDMSAYVHYVGSNTRTNVVIQFDVGGVLVGPIGSGGYIRSVGGHNEAGVSIRHLLIVPNGTTSTVTVNARRFAGAGATVNMNVGLSEWLILRLQ